MEHSPLVNHVSTLHNTNKLKTIRNEKEKRQRKCYDNRLITNKTPLFVASCRLKKTPIKQTKQKNKVKTIRNLRHCWCGGFAINQFNQRFQINTGADHTHYPTVVVSAPSCVGRHPLRSLRPWVDYRPDCTGCHLTSRGLMSMQIHRRTVGVYKETVGVYKGITDKQSMAA